MKKNTISYAFILFVATLLTTSCTRERVLVPSHKVLAQEHHITGYEKLNISSAFTVYVRFSDSINEISIEANENLHSYIEVKKVGSELRIGLEDDINLRRGATLVAYVTTKSLNGLRVSGASKVYLKDPLVNSSLRLNLSGASRLKGALKISDMQAAISGASDLDLEGDVETLELSASGASKITDYDLVTQYLEISLSGASKAVLGNEKEMHIYASGASTFLYKGNGLIKSIKTSGASKVEKRN